MTSGKACVYARHLCVKAGVKFVLGDPDGKIENLIVSGSSSSRRATGVKTADGKTHGGDLVIVAGRFPVYCWERMLTFLKADHGPHLSSPRRTLRSRQQLAQ